MEGACIAFTVDGRPHALPLAAVQEVLRLPMLQAPESAPAHVAGLFNLRGEVVTVLDLAARLGLPPRPARVEDELIVLRPREREPHWALWVEGSEGVVAFETLLPPQVLPEGEAPPCFDQALGFQGPKAYHVLDLPRLLRAPAPPGPPVDAMAALPEEARALLEARAEACLGTQEGAEEARRSALAFELNGEAFGLQLRDIREIAPCPVVHPLPGAPAPYLGLVNHRGEPLLVVDLRPWIGLPALPRGDEGGHLLVVDDGAGRLGLYVSTPGRVVRLDPGASHPPLWAHEAGEWAEGAWVVEGRPLTLLNLGSLLAQTVPPE